MARRKVAAEVASDLDSALEAALDVASQKHPGNIYTTAGDEARCLCLPVPALAPRVLVRQEGFPLGRFYLLDGKKESCKTAFGYELIRWTRLLKGKGKIIEVEDKRSPTLGLSINRYDYKAYSTHYCDTMQDWNAALTYWIHEFIDIMDGVKGSKTKKNRPGVGRIAPVTLMIDSIMAAVGDDTMEEITEEGHGKRRFASDTALLSEFLKVFTKWIPEYPFIVAGVNHLKPTQDSRGFQVRHMPGGKAPEYHAALDIEMTRMQTDASALVGGREFIPLRMKTQKNSTAPKSEIEVKFWWYTDLEHPTESGECLQLSWFDWDAASIDCIFEQMGSGGLDIAKRLREVTGLRFVGEKSKGTVVSDVLEISEDDPLNFTEAGRKLEDKIQADKSFRDALYPLMGVQRRFLLQPEVDYRSQIKDAQEAMAHEQILREKIIVAHHGGFSGRSTGVSTIDAAVEEEQKDPFGD
jgi:hypothetical protein